GGGTRREEGEPGASDGVVRGQPGGAVVRPDGPERAAGAQAPAVVQGQGEPDVRGHAFVLAAAPVAWLALERAGADRRKIGVAVGIPGDRSLSGARRTIPAGTPRRAPASRRPPRALQITPPTGVGKCERRG